ncbi:MAG: thiamine pyrophosphate-binding protein, partial [Erysipelotrichaceae bacterium]
IKQCFMIVGGGAMHLNDAIGHHPDLHCTYNHHEQASAIAAEAYARVDNKMAALCVTTGPGGTNAITGVLGAWLDSIPMFVISGQVRYDTSARYTEQFTEGLSLRAVGDQEYDISKSISHMCKYATMIEDPYQIRYALEKALYLAKTGRKGPVWIDIPVNFQGLLIETDQLVGYDAVNDQISLPNQVDETVIEPVLKCIKNAKRPVLYVGNGLRLSGGYDEFRKVLDHLGVPVVTGWNSIDALEDDHPLYVGRGGIMGDRAGNFAVQNADLVIAIGNRLSIRQVGYNWKTWAREAFVIMVDVDQAEMKKHTIHVDLAIWADAKDFLEALNRKLLNSDAPYYRNPEWIKICQNWKLKYPVTQAKHWLEDGKYTNVYAFIKYLSGSLPEHSLTVVSNGSACVVGSHNYEIQKGSRFLINSATASMGYGLPAAIGACIANGNKSIVCIEGDGSIMMNLQELQTLITHQLPIKLFLINNQGYHSIRQTQNNLFKDKSKIGIGPESHDLSFPDFSKLANAFGLPYYSARSNAEMMLAVNNTLKSEGPVMCEIFVSTIQDFEPKSATKRLEDGTLISPPLEDLAPFLSREELLSNLYIKPIDTK